MRVVFVSRFPVDIDQPRGGVETATVGLALALQQAGVEDLHIVTLEKGLNSVVRETHQGIEIHRLPRSRCPMIIDVFGGPGYRSLKRYLGQLKPTIVHFHETWGMGAPSMGFPSIFTVHGFDSLNLPTEQSSAWRLRSMFWSFAEWLGLRRQKYLISIAPYVFRELRPRTKARIFEIWNSLDSRYFRLERQEQPGKILFLGWINARKNPLTLVRAAAKLKNRFPDMKVELCGEESDADYARQLRQEIASLGVESMVNLRGRLNQSEVVEMVKTSSLMVLPSLQENAPMVVAESMAASLPVVASNLCGIPDMIEDGVSGLLIDPMDVDELASRLAELMDDQTLRRRLGDAAHRQSYEKFHPESVAAATLAAYREVLDNG